MASSPTAGAERPSSLVKTQSFTRFEPTSPPIRSRTNTLSDEATGPPMLASQDDVNDGKTPTAAAAPNRRNDSLPASATASPEIEHFPENFDELPIELASLTDRFVTSLTTSRVYPTPPSVEKLSDLFQDFYLQAESHISTHVQELSSRHYRDSSPARSVSSRSSTRKASKDTLERKASGTQMLSSSEIYDRRRARKLLEYKRGALEEATERKVCEEVYDRIWRHRSTLDEERDEKLRSRTAGLAVMGIGLKELGVDLKLAPQAGEWIAKARASLVDMDGIHYPLGKLQSLASAHQSIVELLSSSHSGPSSADEILPTLIYALIGAPVDRMNLISNVHFIQRFRTASKINGEAAYCLTNLEAAITFLETVDITSLSGIDETEGASKQSSVTSPPVPGHKVSFDDRPEMISPTPSQESVSRSKKASSNLTIEIKPSPPVSPAQTKRPLSSLFQPSQAALGAAGDAVRKSADEGLQNIGNALDKSFNFMFGRLREHSVAGSTSNVSGTIVVAPRTLDDARRLVSPKAMIEEDGLLSEESSITETEEPPQKEDRILDMITGSRAVRDRSADSAGSAGSGRKASRPGLAADSRTSTSSTGVLGASPPGAVESMKSLGNSLNPLNRFAGMNVMKGFGRSSPSPVVTQAVNVEAASTPPAVPTPVTSMSNVEPPLQQFLETSDPAQLRLGDIALLLKDYKRLADVVKARGLL